MSADATGIMSDDRLDRLMAQALTDRAEDVASVAVPASLMTELIRQRRGVRGAGSPNLRMVVAFAIVTLLVVASLAALVIGLQPKPPSIVPAPSTSSAPSESAAPSQGGIRAGAMSEVCDMRFQLPVQDVLGIVLRLEEQTPPDAVPRSVCQLYDVAVPEPTPVEGPVHVSGGSSPEGYVGNIHVFEPPADNELEARIAAILAVSSPPFRYDLGGTPVFIQECVISTCSSAVFIADDRYLVMLLIDPDYLPGSDDLPTLERVAQAVIDALAAGEVGVP